MTRVIVLTSLFPSEDLVLTEHVFITLQQVLVLVHQVVYLGNWVEENENVATYFIFESTDLLHELSHSCEGRGIESGV